MFDVDLTPLVWFALIGFIATIGGIAWLIWFLLAHVSVIVR